MDSSASGRSCVGCGRPLSRYNTGNRCQECTRSERGTQVVHADHVAGPIRIPGNVWHTPETAEILRDRDFAEIFALAREHGASLTNIATATGISYGNVSRITHGQIKVTSLERMERVAMGFRMPDSARVTLGLAPLTHSQLPVSAGEKSPAGPGTTAADTLSLSDFSGELRRLMGERGIGIRELARKVPCDQALISRATNGKAWLSPKVTARCDQILCTDGKLTGLLRARPAPQTFKRSTEDVEEIMRRRAFLLNAAMFAGIGGTDPAAALRAARRGLHSSFPGHGDADVTEWNEISWDYGETYLITPPAQLLRSLLPDLAGLQEAFLRYPQETSQRELWRASALLSGFVAQTANNLGRVTEARQWWRTARYSAERSGDAFSVLWVRVREAIHAWHQYPHATVLRLIEEADQFAGCAPPEPVLQLLWAKARTLAMLGNGPEAENALVQLRERFNATSSSGASRSLLVSGLSRLYDAESFVYSWLGNDRKAENAQHETSALFKDDSTNVRWAAEVQMQAAFCLVRKGDVTEGVTHARDVILELPSAQRTQNFFFDARDVLNSVPKAEQKRPAVSEYRAWLNSASRQSALPV